MQFAIKDIRPNPFRHTERYPIKAEKVEALRSTGYWGNIEARLVNGHPEIAYGHHRLAALTAEYGPEKRVDLIVRDLSDEDMLKRMARENMEEYRSDFLCLLETWEAAVEFLPSTEGKPIDIARLLGWTRLRGGTTEQMNNTASACHAAHIVISGGYLARDALRDLSVKAAREMVENAHSQMKALDAMRKKISRPAEAIEGAKKHIGKAVEFTAQKWRDKAHGLAMSDLRGEVEVNTYRFAHEAKKRSPVFAAFGKDIADGIARWLHGDAYEEKLKEVRKVLGDITLDEDKRIIAGIRFELRELIKRAQAWDKRLSKGTPQLPP
jgi:ParB-like chromosome segregation protein Spo0J